MATFTNALYPSPKTDADLYQIEKMHQIPAAHYEENGRKAHQRHTATAIKLITLRTILTPIVSLLAVSRTISLFFQSAFHLSLTVLVRYRSRANI